MSSATDPGLERLLAVADSEIDRELCRRSLLEFIEAAWHVVEPGAEYVPGWHIRAVADHLEAVTRGDIRNLLINIPPRHTKSLTVSVFWPMWVWTSEPAVQWLYSSAEGTLAMRDSRKSRRLVQSQWYQERWPLELTSDQNVKTWFENAALGYRLATTVGGAGTGHGGDVIVVDDPHKVQEADSAVKREAVLIWWDEVMSTRLNRPEEGGKVIIMQRVHERDLSAHVLEQGGYEHLMLPAEFDPGRRCVTSLGVADPRAEEDELLWPERINRDALDDLKATLGSHGSSGQLQQLPTPRGGSFFRWGWLDRPAEGWSAFVDAVPKDVRSRVRYWDTAGTEDGGDYTAGARVSHGADGLYYIEHVHRGQWAPGRRDMQIRETCQDDAELGGRYEVGLERDAGVGGEDRTRAIVKQLSGLKVYTDRPTGSKESRADPVASQMEVGNVRIVRGPWNQPFLDELLSFPNGEHDDQVDALSGAFARLASAPAPAHHARAPSPWG